MVRQGRARRKPPAAPPRVLQEPDDDEASNSEASSDAALLFKLRAFDQMIDKTEELISNCFGDLKALANITGEYENRTALEHMQKTSGLWDAQDDSSSCGIAFLAKGINNSSPSSPSTSSTSTGTPSSSSTSTPSSSNITSTSTSRSRGFRNSNKAGSEDSEASSKQQATVSNPSSASSTVKTATHSPAQKPAAARKETLTMQQLDGLNWLVQCFKVACNARLVDVDVRSRMMQITIMLSSFARIGMAGPFLIVGPASTMQNWLSLLERHIAELRAMHYTGGHEQNEQLARVADQKKPCRPTDHHIFVLDYETFIEEHPHLKQKHYKHIILDEGHRASPNVCKIRDQISAMSSDSKILLSGTPVQADLPELWGLIGFVMPPMCNKGVTELTVRLRDEVPDASQEVRDIYDRLVTRLTTLVKPFQFQCASKRKLLGAGGDPAKPGSSSGGGGGASRGANPWRPEPASLANTTTSNSTNSSASSQCTASIECTAGDGTESSSKRGAAR